MKLNVYIDVHVEMFSYTPRMDILFGVVILFQYLDFGNTVILCHNIIDLIYLCNISKACHFTESELIADTDICT